MATPGPNGALQSVGKRLPRVDARERVTGSAVYPADLKRRAWRMASCCAARTRTPASAASTRRAREALPGVLAVVTAADFPELPIGASIPMGETGYDMWMVAQINMARGKVFWVGQPVAAVAAVDVYVAEAALALIEVDYEPLPAVIDLAAAMAPDAPVLHEHVFTKGVEPRPRSPSNVCSRTVIARGDAARALWRSRPSPPRSASPSTPPTRATSSLWLRWRGRRQRLRHRLGLHAGPVHRRADDRPHARAAAFETEGRAAGSGRRVRRQDRHPRRGGRRAPRPEVRPARQDRAHARGGSAGRLRPAGRRADRCRGRRGPRWAPDCHQGLLPPGCRRSSRPRPVPRHAGVHGALPVSQPRPAGLRRRHQQAAHGGLSRALRHPGGLRHGAGDGRAQPAARPGPPGIPQAQRLRHRQPDADRHAVPFHRAHRHSRFRGHASLLDGSAAAGPLPARPRPCARLLARHLHDLGRTHHDRRRRPPDGDHGRGRYLRRAQHHGASRRRGIRSALDDVHVQTGDSKSVGYTDPAAGSRVARTSTAALVEASRDALASCASAPPRNCSARRISSTTRRAASAPASPPGPTSPSQSSCRRP